MDETEADDVVTVGQRLREAREAKGLSIEDIAASTRIPTRHLTSLENSEWDKLPAATYSIGFAKNYAGAVGLDRNEIGEALRTEMGGSPRTQTIYPEVYEAADPARTMPKGLVFGALGLLLVVVLGLTWMNSRSMTADETAPPTENVAAADTNIAAPAAAPAPAASGPVVLTATDTVWIAVKDGGKTLKQGELATGESYQIPADAVAPVLTTGKPEALRITVGTTAGETVSGVSLLGPDLLRGPATAAPAVAPPAAATPAPARTRARAPAPSPAPPPAASSGTATGNTAAPATQL